MGECWVCYDVCRPIVVDRSCTHIRNRTIGTLYQAVADVDGSKDVKDGLPFLRRIVPQDAILQCDGTIPAAAAVVEDGSAVLVSAIAVEGDVDERWRCRAAAAAVIDKCSTIRGRIATEHNINQRWAAIAAVLSLVIQATALVAGRIAVEADVEEHG